MNKYSFHPKKIFFAVLFLSLSFGAGTKAVFAQNSPSVLYVPLIGITSVPTPLALPKGPGRVTYNYAVKNFLSEMPLANIQVVDDHCSPVKFAGGDDNNDGKLDFSETWRYSCTANLATTTRNTATATGNLNNITATHQASATVIVGSNVPAPLVSIVNITKIGNPLYLSATGSLVTLTFKVNNPGIAPLSDVSVTDNNCSNMSGKLGDTDGNNLLDANEVWIYNCTANLTRTISNTATVTAFANGLQAVDSTTFDVNVAASIQPAQNLFDVQISPAPESNEDFKITVWKILSAVLAGLTIIFSLTRKSGLGKV